MSENTCAHQCESQLCMFCLDTCCVAFSICQSIVNVLLLGLVRLPRWLPSPSRFVPHPAEQAHNVCEVNSLQHALNMHSRCTCPHLCMSTFVLINMHSMCVATHMKACSHTHACSHINNSSRIAWIIRIIIRIIIIQIQVACDMLAYWLSNVRFPSYQNRPN